MTDDLPATIPDLDPTSWLARDREVEKLNKSLRSANKAVLFDVLAQAGIASVVVNFNGYGDSGQIEGIDAKVDDVYTELPSLSVEIASVEFDNPVSRRATIPIRDVIEQLAYDLLRETHCGWENSEGAFGDFTFDVAERTITLDYNERIEASEYTQHVF